MSRLSFIVSFAKNAARYVSAALICVQLSALTMSAQETPEIETPWETRAVEFIDDVFSRDFMPGKYEDFRALERELSDEEILERHLEFVFHDSFIGPSFYPQVLEEMDTFLEETGLEVSDSFRRISQIGYETSVSHEYRRGLEQLDAFLRERNFTIDEYVRALILQADFLLALDQDIDAANVARDITGFTNRHPVSDLVAFDVAQIEIRIFQAHTEPAQMLDLLSREYWMIQDQMLPYTVSSTPHKVVSLLYENGKYDELALVSERFLEATADDPFTYLRSDALHSCTLVNLARQNYERALECAIETEAYITEDDYIRFDWAVTAVEAALAVGDIETAQTYFDILAALPDANLNNRNQFIVAELEARLLAQSGDLQSAYNAMLAFHQTKARVIDNEIRELAANQMQYLQEEAERISERADLLNLQNTLQQRTIRLFQWLTALFALLLVVSVAFAFTMLRKNREVIQARDDARRMSKVKSRFLANMSHEVRTPMNGVIGLAGALEKTELDPRQSELVGLIQQSSNLLTKVLDDILDLSRIESDKVIIEPREFSPRALFDETHTFFEASTERDNLVLSFQSDIDPSLTAIGDASRIRQVLYNLISNALKFTDSGKVDVRCWVYQADADNACAELCFSVEDTGSGIPEDKLRSIFDPFVQADSSSTRKFGGLGLGLAISRQLLDLMGGRIEVTSTLGTGTHIEFRVPTEIAEASVPLPGEAETQAPIEHPDGVLVAEDHHMNRKVIEVLMEGIGIKPFIVETGLDAVAAYRKEAFRFVLLDIQMPVMDGLEALALMKEIDAEEGRTPPRYIAFTANAMTHQTQAYLDAGFDAILTKPIDARDLVNVLSASPATGQLT